jgi:F0F1-type ATP synthase delta subunit
MNRVEERMDTITADLKELKTSSDKQFGEIKSMLTQAKDEKFKVMVTVAGTVIVGLIGLLGYVITHLPK